MNISSLNGLLDGERPDGHVVARAAGRLMTVRQLRADVALNVAALTARKVNRAILVCEDSYRFLVGLVALLQSGAEVVLPPNMRSGTLRSFTDTGDVLVTDRALTDFADAVVLGEDGPDVPPFALDIDHRPVDFFTSGSTGAMKRVRKTLGAFAREAAVLQSLWDEKLRGTAVTGMVTHQHVYGLTFRVIWPLLAGRYFSTTTHLVWETLLAEMTEIAAPVAIVSSPAHLTRLGGLLADAISSPPVMIFSAGAPLSAAAARDVGDVFGLFPLEIFGSTETGVVAWRSGPSETPLWRPVPGVEILPTDTGLLRVQSPFLDGQSSHDLADRVTLSEDGQFRFEGRADRIVKIEGMRVSMPQVEQAVIALRWIEDAAVAVIDDGRQSLGAVAILSEEGRAERDNLGNFRFVRLLRRELGTTQDVSAVPRRWRFVDRLPVDGMGKRRVQDIQALLMEPA